MKKNFYTLLGLIGIMGIAFWWNYNSTPTAYISGNDDLEEERFSEKERENPIARMEHEFNMLKDPATGKIPKDAQRKAMRFAQKANKFQLQPTPNQKSIPTITVTERGPNNYGGRTRALEFDSQNSNIVLSGGVSGGIFRSTDNGNSWTRVTPAGMMHNLTAIAQDDNTSTTWYAGTGENLGNSTSLGGATYLGFGMWKSTDNGITWSAINSTQAGNGNDPNSYDDDFDYISRILVQSGVVYVMAGETIKRSTNGGDSWTTVLGVDNFGQPGDIIYNSNASKFYAAIHGDATQDQGIHSSTDGITWTLERSTTQLATGGVKRIVLANAGSTAGIVAFYELNSAHSCGGSSSSVGLQHFDGTSTWTNHTNNISDCASGSTDPKEIDSQGGYNMAIATKPNDANLVYFGGVSIYRYDLSNTTSYDYIGGTQFAANLTNLHVDNHILKFQSNNILWAGNDGGLRSTDVTGAIQSNVDNETDGFTWTSKTNGYVTYQFFDADIHPTNGSNFIAGAAQDNAFTIHPTDAAALEVGPTADGISIAILGGTSFTDFTILAASQEGGLDRVTNSGCTNIQPNGKSQDFNSFFYADFDNNNLLFYPDNGGGLSRTRISSTIGSGTFTGNAGTGWEAMTGVSISGFITTMEMSRNVAFGGSAYSASDTNRKMYFGTDAGKVFRLNDPAFGAVGNVPVDITPGSASGYCSDVAINPMDDKEVIVTFSNYNVVSVFHTADASVANPTWTNIEGPSSGAVNTASARCAAIVNSGASTVYLVGTSAGLFATDALSGATTSWSIVGSMSNIGIAVCSEMRHRTSDNQMVLGTHGNGAFQLSFPAALAVELVSFEGTATDEGNLLKWETTTEINNEGFEIEKSLDGDNFENIGFVNGRGDSFETHAYDFLDPDAKEKIAYYRLKQIDFDGTFDYSAVISIFRERENDLELKLYPNPVVNTLTIENGEGLASIFNIAGQKLMEVTIGSNNSKIDVGHLPTGNYIFTLQNNNGVFITRQFTK